MKELYRKGLASHSDPESCGGIREDTVEALTGAHASRLFSCVIRYFGRAEPVLVGFSLVNATPLASLNGEMSMVSPQSKIPRAHGTFLHGNRETSLVARERNSSGPAGKGLCRTAGVYAGEESDISIVLEISPNKGLKHLRRGRRKG